MDPIGQIYKIFLQNPLAWGMYYFPEHFRDESPAFHLKIMRESLINRFLAIAAPRESAKSTIISFLRPAHGIAFKQFHHIVICQNTYKKAARSLETIKDEFKGNSKLIQDFPIEIIKDSEGDSIFKHLDEKNGFETRVLCKGAEQLGSVRGEKFGAYRPDLIIVDDLENDEMVRNPELRVDLQELYDDALEPAIDKNTGRIMAIGTILHDDCLMKKLVINDQYTRYRKLFYQARYKNRKTGQMESLWPAKWTLEELNELERNNPRKFAKEYQNDPVSGLMSNFDKKDFRRWYIENDQYVLYDDENNVISKGDLKHCKPAISCDLAWEERRSSDYSVVMPGFLTPNSEILIDTYFCQKGVKPDKLMEVVFTMEERLRKLTGKTVPIGFEKGKLEKAFRWALKQEERRRNHFLRKKDLMWDGDKITRIVTRLQPRYNQHVIFHRTGMGDLEYQLLRVPSGAHEDLPDAAQGLVQLLQFAPSKKQEKKQDDMFERLRQNAIDRTKKKKPVTYLFGKKGKRLSRIPCKISILD